MSTSGGVRIADIPTFVPLTTSRRQTIAVSARRSILPPLTLNGNMNSTTSFTDHFANTMACLYYGRWDTYKKTGIFDSSFYYLPEIDLYPQHRRADMKNEIDLLCVIGGKFYAVEIKVSATGFIDKSEEVKNFIEEIRLIVPDAALLVFEQYCPPGADVERTKTRLKEVVAYIADEVGQHITLETVVASDFEEFNTHPLDSWFRGRRASKILANR